MVNSVGKPLDRVDGKLKVTGRALYAAEHPVPNAAAAVLVMSAIPKGRITKMDTSAAERSPGVLAVMTHLNAPKLPPPDANAPKASTTRKLNLLQDDQMLYSNQPIAVAVADTLENATRAAELVRVEYAAEPFNVSLERGLGQAYDPGKVGGAGDPADSNRGDVKAGRAAAASKMSGVYVTPIETHNPMEPHATIAVWEGESRLTLYDSTQGVFSDRQRVATLLGLHPDDVRVVSPFLGGGFGSKGPTWSHVVLCAMAAKQVKRPVRLVMKREQMFGPVGFRGRTHQTVALSAAADGTLASMEHYTVDQTSSFDQFVEPCSLQARMLYESQNTATTHRVVRLDMGTPSFMRAPGEAPGNYALECAMDELSYALKMDPVQLRLKNYASQDPEKNKPWSSKSLKECYAQGADRFGWTNRKPGTRAVRDGQWLVGQGMATACYPTRRSASSAVAKLRKDGTALVEAGTQDLGTGTYTIMTQIAADAIGLEPKGVTFRLGDTDFPETPVSGGSQTAASTGSAVKLAGQALREKLVQLAIGDQASAMHGLGANDVTIDGGFFVSVGNPSKRESLAAFMGRQAQEIEAKAHAKPGQEKEDFSMYAFGAAFAEVKVDADLGQIRVNRLVGAFGAGKILNAKTARSQLMGGMIWGIGMALHEETLVDKKRGRVVNGNLAEYHVPVNLDAPVVDIIMVDEVDPHVNEVGAKGVGEIGITGTTAAIANAIYHATGKRVRELPITPDKLI